MVSRERKEGIEDENEDEDEDEKESVRPEENSDCDLGLWLTNKVFGLKVFIWVR